MRLIDANRFRRFAHEQLDEYNVYSVDEILEMIDEQPTVEEKPKKKGWKCKPHQKGFLYRLSRECCYEQQVVNGNARSGKCGGVMGCDKSFDYLNSYCVSCPYLVLSKYEREIKNE